MLIQLIIFLPITSWGYLQVLDAIVRHHSVGNDEKAEKNLVSSVDNPSTSGDKPRVTWAGVTGPAWLANQKRKKVEYVSAEESTE